MKDNWLKNRRGHPQSALFSLFSYTCTDSFCLAPLQWLNKPKKQETKKWHDPTLCHYSPLGVCILFVSLVYVFFWFLALFYCFVFFVFWFVVVFFEGLAKQHKSEGPGPNSLPVLPLFRGCKIVFDCFIICFGPVVPLENHVKTIANAGITGRSLGFGTPIRQFCLFMYLSKFV